MAFFFFTVDKSRLCARFKKKMRKKRETCTHLDNKKKTEFVCLDYKLLSVVANFLPARVAFISSTRTRRDKREERRSAVSAQCKAAPPPPPLESITQ